MTEEERAILKALYKKQQEEHGKRVEERKRVNGT